MGLGDLGETLRKPGELPAGLVEVFDESRDRRFQDLPPVPRGMGLWLQGAQRLPVAICSVGGVSSDVATDLDFSLAGTLKAHEVIDEMILAARERQAERQAVRTFWWQLPFVVLGALTIAGLIQAFVLEIFSISSSSMSGTLEVHDHVAVGRLSYSFGGISRGDVIVFRVRDVAEAPKGKALPEVRTAESSGGNGSATSDQKFVKRVVGLPGETIEVRNGVVLIDGSPLTMAYFTTNPSIRYGPTTVPADHLFVLGDNLSISEDSREIGPIPIKDVVGRALAVVWPPGRIRTL